LAEDTMKPTLLITRAAVAVALALRLSAVGALDLVESYQRALEADPSFQAAGEAVIAGREKAVQGRALVLPQLTLSGAYRHLNEKTDTGLPQPLSNLVKQETSGNVNQAQLQLVQPLYDAKAFSDRRQLTEQTGLAEVNYRNAQQDLIQRVSEAYFNVLLAQETLRVTQAQGDAVQMQRDRAQARFDVGRGRITDLQEAQARYDSVLSQEVAATSSLELRRAQYQELTGVVAESLADLRAGFQPVPPRPDDLRDWQFRGHQNNVRVQSKQRELAVAMAEIDKYRVSGRPTLSLVASLSHTGQSGGLPVTVAPDYNRSSSVGVQLTIPLYAGGSINSHLRESLAKKRQAEQELSAAERDARLQVQDAFLAVRTGVTRISSLEQSLLSAQTALEATTLGRDVGTRTELDVLDAQQRVYSAQLDLAQARNDYLLGRIRLASAAGDLKAVDLEALNGYLTH
jgi:outer membrane protein